MGEAEARQQGVEALRSAIKEGIEDLMTTAIGDEHTNKLTKQWLSVVFRELGFE